jgi:ubiquitin carboxyl-terminal hydrolase 25/28
MVELRKLFALLVGSQRSYVDPSRAVGILRAGAMGGGGEGQFTNSQQDVSEFTHNLLDWLEEAFKINTTDEESKKGGSEMSDPDAMDSESEKCDKEKETHEEEEESERKERFENREKKPVNVDGGSSNALLTTTTNPMKNLFYGLVKIEGRNQGNVFTKEEPFGQWPLQVNNFSDIHESLNASTAHEHIDTSSQSDLVSAASQSEMVSAASSSASTSLRNSGQERWFTKLPPVSSGYL